MTRTARLLTIAAILLVYVQQLFCAKDFTECKNKYSGDKGVCFTNSKQKCPTHEFAFLNGGSICKTDNKTYFTYCCPHKEQFIETGKRAKAVCDYYRTQLPQWRPSYNGVPVLLNEFKHMAALAYNTTGKLVWGCSGSLISNTFILTAAHCLSSPQFGKVSFIRISELDLNNKTQKAIQTDFRVVETFVHPKYKRPSHYYDIGLVRTEFIEYGIVISPACLYISQDFPINQFTATGWGKKDFIGGENTKLLKVALNLIPISRCRDRYATASKRKLSKGIDEETQFCAGHPLGNDPCPGDSGGPFQMLVDSNRAPQAHFNEHYSIIGITSFGKGCGQTDSIGVYTKVASFVRWIEDIVWPI